MSLGLFLYEAYLVALAVMSLVAAELVARALLGSGYLEAKAEAEQLVEELRGGQLPRRRRTKYVARLTLARRRLRRYVLARLAIITPAYAAVSLAALMRPAGVPLGCCIPGIAVEAGGACVSVTPLLVALAFLTALPIVQEDVVHLYLYLRSREPRQH